MIIENITPEIIKRFPFIKWNLVFRSFGKNLQVMKKKKEFKVSEIKLINSFLKQNNIQLLEKEND